MGRFVFRMEGHNILCDKLNTYTFNIISLSDNWHRSVFRPCRVKGGGAVATVFQIYSVSELTCISTTTAVNNSFLSYLKDVLETICSADMQTSRLRIVFFIARRIYFARTENIFISPLSYICFSERIVIIDSILYHALKKIERIQIWRTRRLQSPTYYSVTNDVF